MTMLGPQFEQLKMFMTAPEIKEQYRPLPADRQLALGHTPSRKETDDELWTRKASEMRKRYDANTAAVDELDHMYYTSKSRQVGEPIPLATDAATPHLQDAHHRVAVYAEDRPERLLPVVHSAEYQRKDRYLGAGVWERWRHNYDAGEWETYIDGPSDEE